MSNCKFEECSYLVLLLSTGIRLPFLSFAMVFVTLVVLGTWYTLIPIGIVLAYVALEYYRYPLELRQGGRECCYHRFSPILLALYFCFFLNIAFLVIHDVEPSHKSLALNIAFLTPVAVLVVAYGAMLLGQRQIHKHPAVVST